uniref:Uncharacterized protein n=1 Tax=Anguilla anguilla TaxID=7936 RepID=A0A0E9VIT0_ANGAN
MGVTQLIGHWGKSLEGAELYLAE